MRGFEALGLCLVKRDVLLDMGAIPLAQMSRAGNNMLLNEDMSLIIYNSFASVCPAYETA